MVCVIICQSQDARTSAINRIWLILFVSITVYVTRSIGSEVEHFTSAVKRGRQTNDLHYWFCSVWAWRHGDSNLQLSRWSVEPGKGGVSCTQGRYRARLTNQQRITWVGEGGGGRGLCNAKNYICLSVQSVKKCTEYLISLFFRQCLCSDCKNSAYAIYSTCSVHRRTCGCKELELVFYVFRILVAT